MENAQRASSQVATRFSATLWIVFDRTSLDIVSDFGLSGPSRENTSKLSSTQTSHYSSKLRRRWSKVPCIGQRLLGISPAQPLHDRADIDAGREQILVTTQMQIIEPIRWRNPL